MSEQESRRRAEAYADQSDDEQQEEHPSVYRDGNACEECWNHAEY